MGKVKHLPMCAQWESHVMQHNGSSVMLQLGVEDLLPNDAILVAQEAAFGDLLNLALVRARV